MKHLVMVLLVVGMMVAACGNDGGVSLLNDTTEDAAADADLAPDVHEIAPEAGPDADAAPELPDLPPDLAETDLLPEEGAPGWPCDKGSECDSGHCVMTSEGKQCTIECIDECPNAWQCELFAAGGPDQVNICVPPFLSLCRPCEKNADCAANGVDTGDACLVYGPEGNYCGGNCDQLDCPKGYSCAYAADVAGFKSYQCKATGQCECNAWFADQGAKTACFAKNEWGTCPGERQCDASGLTACSALIPAKETCNGKDDDCDGQTDEGTSGAECPISNKYGTCMGVESCVAGTAACVGDQPAPEVCDGLDNNCSGTADETFPDTDKDGIADCLEGDKDGDGIADVKDNCPADFNPGQEDADVDTVGDACDPDDDNDKVKDEDDCAPLDWNVYPGAIESCNGKDDDCNGLVDEGFPDSDADGWKNCVDDDDDADGTADALDCAPADPFIHPAAAEKCDGLDNDCDNQVDEGFPDLDGDGEADCLDQDPDGDGLEGTADNCPALKNPGQEDQDKDGVGDACDGDLDGDGIPNGLDNCKELFNPAQSDVDKDGLGDACDGDPDGDDIPSDADNCPLVKNPTQADTDGDGLGDACDGDLDGDGDPDDKDCAPDDFTVSHKAAELCDGKDNNCNGLLDEGFPDFDMDGLKDCIDLDDDNDGTGDDADCKPHDPSINPLSPEKCDGLDNDCSGAPDDGLPEVACGKGACLHSQPTCANGVQQPCDPFAGAVPEKCDGLDNDCNGIVDDWFMDDDEDGIADCVDPDKDGDDVPNGQDNCPAQHNPYQADADKDGIGDACDADKDGDGDPNEIDCQPDNPLVFHGQAESCDKLDNNCNGQADEPGAAGCLAWFADVDGDGFGKDGDPSCLCGPAGKYSATVAGDCNDVDPAVFPDAAEVADGKDNDCDQAVDEGTVLKDDDGDGLSEIQGDCDDSDPAVHPGAKEVTDGKDNDCDGLVDEGTATTDDDGDGFSEVAGDCDDANKDIYPGAKELPDGKDNDCDGKVDEGTAIYDGDKDGWFASIDCNDEDPAVYPGASEVPYDGKDQDCDGKDLVDVDNDGYVGKPAGGDDCNDANATIYPGAKETPYDTIDQDCDGKDLVDADGDGHNATLAGGDDCNDTDPNAFPGAPEVPYDGVDQDCDGKDAGTYLAWKYYQPVKLTNTTSNDLKDYEVRLDLSPAATTFWANVLSTGNDIRLSDADLLTPLPFYVEKFDDAAHTATVWVNVPIIGAAQSKNIYLFYGNAAATSASSLNQTFAYGGPYFYSKVCCSGGTCTTTATIANGNPLFEADGGATKGWLFRMDHLKVDYGGDVGGGSEYLTFYINGQDKGTCPAFGHSDGCSQPTVGTWEIDVTGTSIEFKCTGSSSVGNHGEWLNVRGHYRHGDPSAMPAVVLGEPKPIGK